MIVRAAVIGVGSMGRHHARNYASLQGVQLVGVVDANPNTASEIARAYGCAVFPDVESAASAGIDVASVCVPTSRHVAAAVPLLKAGVSVLIEKPVAPTEEEAEVIRCEAQRHGAKVAIGHIERFNPAVRSLKRVIDSGRLGAVLQIMTRREGPNPDRIRDAGIILDIGSHDIDILSHLIGHPPTGVYASGGRVKRSDLEDYANLMLVYQGGPRYQTTGYVQVNWVTRGKVRRIEVTGTEGYASADLIRQTVSVHSLETPPVFENYEDYIKAFGSDRCEEVTVEKAEPLRLELENFVQWSKAEPGDVVSIEDGIAVVRIAAYATNQIRIQRMAAESYGHKGAAIGE